MIRSVSFGVLALLVVLTWSSSQGLSPNPQPNNVTALVATSAIFSCGPAEDGALVTWSMQTVTHVFINSTHSETITGEQELFYVDQTTLLPVYAANVSSDKYGVTNNHFLVVKNVDTTDAVPYFCSSPDASDVDNRAYANLIVIVDVTSNFYALTSQSVALACDVSLMAPNPYVPICPPHSVQLSLLVANETLQTKEIPSPTGLVNLAINFTISRSNLINQTLFTCLLTSTSGGAPYRLIALGNIEAAAPEFTVEPTTDHTTEQGTNRASSLLQSTGTICLAILVAFFHPKIQKFFSDLK